MITPISTDEAVALLRAEGADIYRLFHRAHEVRMACRGNTVNLCGIVNAKSGWCQEDCKFCAQSAHNNAKISCYSLIDSDEMVAKAKETQSNKATRFGIVTSGLAVEDPQEVETIADAVAKIRQDMDVAPCASLGKVSKQTLLRLKEAGLTRYHCNLETAESFYPNICTTRSWHEAVKTVQAAKEVGLDVCSGGLFGLGESLEQRVELLAAVRDLDVDSVPLNFYNPVEGTQVEVDQPITPLECLKVVAVARLMMPTKEIRVCGGREYHLGDLQSWALIAGADGMMVGGYLTTRGRSVEADLKMIADAGFAVSWNHH